MDDNELPFFVRLMDGAGLFIAALAFAGFLWVLV